MAKKKPTSKSIRQGQTVYYVTSTFIYSHGNNYDIKLIPVMAKIFIKGGRSQLLDTNSNGNSSKISISLLRRLLNKDYFYSRNKAIKRFNLLKEDMRKRGVLSAEFE